MTTSLSFFRAAVASVVLLALTACSKGIDKPLVTDKGMQAYHESLTNAGRSFSDLERQAFDWAVSDLSLETLHSRYPNATAREVIRGEVKAVQHAYPDRVTSLETQAAAWKQATSEIQKVTAEQVVFSLDRNFHGLQPTIQATVTNGSRFGYSTLYWRALLYLDGAIEPVATADLTDLYQNESGLKPGESKVRRFQVGFVLGDAEWTTLEIQNAQQRVVKLVVVPERAKDFGEKLIAGDSPEAELRNAERALAAASKFNDI